MYERDSLRRVRSSEAGMSLVEIAVVIMIFAIVAAFALPAVASSIRAYNLRSAAQHMAENLTAVRALAMAKNRSLTFSFNKDSKLYGFDFTGTDGDGVPDEFDPDDTSIAYLPKELPSGLKAIFPEGEDIKVTFNSRGEMPIGDEDQKIEIQNSTKSAIININKRGKVWVE